MQTCLPAATMAAAAQPSTTPRPASTPAAPAPMAPYARWHEPARAAAPVPEPARLFVMGEGAAAGTRTAAQRSEQGAVPGEAPPRAAQDVRPRAMLFNRLAGRGGAGPAEPLRSRDRTGLCLAGGRLGGEASPRPDRAGGVAGNLRAKSGRGARRVAREPRTPRPSASRFCAPRGTRSPPPRTPWLRRTLRSARNGGRP